MNTLHDLKKNNYFSLRKAEISPLASTHVAPCILNILKTYDNPYILDIGCGHGQLLNALRENGYTRAKGIDINKEALIYARDHGLSVSEIESIESYAAKNSEQFDFVNMTHVIEHIEKEKIVDTLRIIREKILKPGGCLYLATPNAQARTGMYWMYEDFTHEWVFTTGSLYYVLKAAGFEDITFADRNGAEGSKPLVNLARNIFIPFYRAADDILNKLTGAAYHRASPRIYTWELKVIARNLYS